MRLISKAFLSLFRSLYKSSTAQEDLTFITSTSLFTCLWPQCAATIPFEPVVFAHYRTTPQWELMDPHMGSPNKSKDHHAPLEAKYLPLARLVLEQGSTGVCLTSGSFLWKSQISSSWTDCRGLSASVKFTSKIFATNSCFWMTFC